MVTIYYIWADDRVERKLLVVINLTVGRIDPVGAMATNICRRNSLDGHNGVTSSPNAVKSSNEGGGVGSIAADADAKAIAGGITESAPAGSCDARGCDGGAHAREFLFF